MAQSSIRLFFATLALMAAQPLSAATQALPPPTLRVDVMHTGNATSEAYSLERVVVEPLPWPGLASRALDDTDRGLARFEVSDPETGAVLYSRGYSTIFG